MKFDYKIAMAGVQQANSVSDAIFAIHQCDEIKFVAFHLLDNVSANIDNPFVRTNYPENWISYYLLNNLVTLDPVVRYATTTREAFNWADLRLSEREGTFMQQAISFGLGASGYSIPCVDNIGRRSVLSINSSFCAEDWVVFLSIHSEELEILGQNLHVKGVLEYFLATKKITILSPRECECLKWISLGKSYTDIAIILGLSAHTIRSYLKVARLKLDAITLAQAVAKATAVGLI